jgi:hypothetical protein
MTPHNGMASFLTRKEAGRFSTRARAMSPMAAAAGDHRYLQDICAKFNFWSCGVMVVIGCSDCANMSRILD